MRLLIRSRATRLGLFSSWMVLSLALPGSTVRAGEHLHKHRKPTFELVQGYLLQPQGGQPYPVPAPYPVPVPVPSGPSGYGPWGYPGWNPSSWYDGPTPSSQGYFPQYPAPSAPFKQALAAPAPQLPAPLFSTLAAPAVPQFNPSQWLSVAPQAAPLQTPMIQAAPAQTFQFVSSPVQQNANPLQTLQLSAAPTQTFQLASSPLQQVQLASAPVQQVQMVASAPAQQVQVQLAAAPLIQTTTMLAAMPMQAPALALPVAAQGLTPIQLLLPKEKHCLFGFCQCLFGHGR